MSVEAMQATLRGAVVMRDHESYDEVRALFNGMIDKKPRYIVQCHDVADVMAAVDFARDMGLAAAIRGGGHNGAGLASVEDGIMIDLSPMNGVRVDPDARTARVEGGATWSDVDHATHAFGLAVPTGIISSTGVAGLTLGGGHGYLTRKYGLTCDSLLEADVVLADGSFVTANEQEHADLFWALRGGGGNFGVVTSFKFRAHPVHTIVGGPMLWNLEDGPAVLAAYDEYVSKMDADTYGFFAYLQVPPGPPFPEELHFKTVCGIVWCHLGTQQAANEAFDVMRAVAKPVFEHTGPMPLPMLNSLFDPLFPSGLQWYWKGDFFGDLNPEAQRLFQQHGEKVPTLLSTMHIYPINGAPQEKTKDATAFSYRDAKYSVVYAGIDPEPTNANAIRAWARDYWEDLHEHSMGGAYVNFMFHDESDQRVKDTYRGNYARLTQVKATYDPDNFFSVNQNIPPTS